MKTAARVLGVALAGVVRAGRPRHVSVDRAAFDAGRALERGGEDRRLIVCYWIEDAFLLILADVWLRSAAPDAVPPLRLVCDDSGGGVVASSILDRLGFETISLRRRREAERVADLQAIIRSTASIGIAVDGHGPYGRVGASFCRLAERCAASIVPIAARARRCLTPRLRARIAVPPPWARIAVAVGEPIVPAAGARLEPETIEAALWAARSAAGERLAAEAGLALERVG